MEYDKVDYSQYYIKNKHTYNGVRQDNTHEIEIEQTDKKSKRKRATQHKRSKAHILGIIVVTLIMLAVIFFLVDAIKGGYIVDSIGTMLIGGDHVKMKYYAIEMNTFEDIESARVYSHEIRKSEGGGYVLFDEGYRVLVEVYASQDDAENVAKKLRLGGENARVYSFDIYDIDYTLFPDSTRNIVKSTVVFNERIYSKLYDIGMELAEHRIDENSAKMRVKGLRDETHNVIVEYTANVDNAIANTNIIKVKAQLSSIESMLDNLAHDVVKRPNLLSDIRYTSCLIINSYRELTREVTFK